MRTKITLGLIAFVLLSGFLYFKFDKKPKPVQAQHQPSAKTNNPERFYEDLLRYKVENASKLQRLEHQVNAKQSFDNKDWYSARSAFMRVLASDEKDFQAWLFLLKSLKELKQQDNYGAYGDEYLNAQHYAKQFFPQTHEQQLIDAIDTVQTPEIQDQLNQTLVQYPKAFAPYFLDIPQESQTGTACLSWTYPLLKKRDIHYEHFIEISPKVKDLGVIARGKELCFEGLQFGQNYQLTIKPSFAAEGDVKLTEAETLSLYIPHRKPSIRFRERGYILTSFGEQVLPFLAVNVPKVLVKVIHIPERNIQSVQQNWFSNQIERWESDRLSEEQGEVIWEGTYNCENEINKTGVTGFPIQKMIGKKLQSGVYVIEARINENSYDTKEFASQAFIVSDIGLSTYQGTDGLYVMARDLSSAKILPGVKINLIARNNRELASIDSNQEGWANFNSAMMNGLGGNAPAFITAQLNGKSFTILNLRNEGFNFSDRGASGRAQEGSLDAYLYSERGIYRPGETAHLTALLRQSNGHAQKQLPLTLKLYRPDGVLAYTTVLNDQGDGGYQHDYEINAAAPSGQWSAQLYVDPEQNSIGATTFEVHDFVPPRIEVKTKSEHPSVKPGQDNPIQVSAQYYFGAAGSELKVDAESVLVKSDKPFSQWLEYQFGLEEESWAPKRFKHKSATTDQQGLTTINAEVDDRPQTTLPLDVVTNVTVFETGGRGKSTKQTTHYWYQPYAIGIRANFKDKTAQSNAKARFDVIAVNQAGQLQNQENLSYTLYAEHHDYIWFRSNYQWQYEIAIRDRVVDSGKISLNGQTPKSLELNLGSDQYRLEVLDEKTGVASSIRFSAGWRFSAEAPDKPDMLDIKYEHGKAIIKSPFAGDLVLAMAGQNFKPVYSGKIDNQTLTVDLAQVAKLAQTGAYLYGTVYQAANVQSAQLPARAIGLAWITNPKALAEHQIDYNVTAPAQIKSNQRIEVKIAVPPSHPNMHVSAALVDEATLALIDYVSPDPMTYFFAQRDFGYQVRDSYGLLINPLGARPGSFEEGAGNVAQSFATRALAALPARAYKVVSLYSGIIDAKNQKEIVIPFDIPEFTGKLRLMTVAWDDKGLGKTTSDVIVKDAIDVNLVLPRFLAPKDSAEIPLVLKNLSGQTGEYQLSVQGENLNLSKIVKLEKDQELTIPMTLKYESNGVKEITLSLSGPDNFKLNRRFELSVRAPVQMLAKQKLGMIAAGKSEQFEQSLLNNLEPSSSESVFSIAATPDYGVKQLANELLQYPYHCLEQTTSRLLATLYATDADKSTLPTAYNQLSALQKIDGSFGLWNSAGYQEPWLSLYAYDVLLQIKNKGHAVPAALTDNLSRWTNEIQQQSNPELMAYAYYLNAKQKLGTLGALKYFVETQGGDLTTKAQRGFIAAAFAYYGDASLAAQWFNWAISAQDATDNNTTFGSKIRDQAILLSLMAETTQQHPKLYDVAQRLSVLINESVYLSTQEKAWIIRAGAQLSAINKDYKFNIQNELVAGQTPVVRTWTKNDLKPAIKINNVGSNPLYYAIATTGHPIDLKKVDQKGFNVKRSIYTLDGQQSDVKKLKSGERYLVVIEGERLNSEIRHVLLVDLLPSGFEVEDANLLKDNGAAVFHWLPSLTPSNRVEGRDDRFFSAYELNQDDHFIAAYVVRAVSKGSFIYPAPYTEAMYQPQYFKYGQSEQIQIH